MSNAAALTGSVDAYELALAEFLKTGMSPDPSLLLKVVVARDLVAQQLKNADAPYEDQLQRLVPMDASFQGAASTAISPDIRRAAGEWRESRQPEDESWWWALDRKFAIRRWYQHQWFAVCVWLAVALSLSIIVEDLRRLLTGATDDLSTAIQALLAFLVGGTAIQYARQLIGVAEKGGRSEPRNQKGQFLLAAVLVLLAVVIYWQRPNAAAWFSNQGTQFKVPRRAQALSYYQRAAALNPDDGYAHMNLASYYEEIFDYDKAEAEYLAAIRANSGLPPAYERLGRLNILRRKDYGNALRLLDIGLREVEAIRPGQVETSRIKSWKYRILVDRAWANFGIAAYASAEDDLEDAIGVYKLRASAYCLLSMVQEKRNEIDAGADSKAQCVGLAPQDAEIEPEWLSAAKEPMIGKEIRSRGGKGKP